MINSYHTISWVGFCLKKPNILPNSSITINLSKCEKALCFLCKSEKVPHSSFYKDKWFLDLDVSTYFTPFESDFNDMTPGNYSWVKTTNSKILLFIVVFGTVLIEHEIFNSEKGTTKVAMSKI